jgi:hypothetical protein
LLVRINLVNIVSTKYETFISIEAFCLVIYDVMESIESHNNTSGRNMSLPSSGLMNKPSKKQA